MTLVVYIILGACAGFLAGLLGVGGGLLIVPVLVMMFKMAEFAPAVLVHLAIGTSLATIVCTSIASVWTHHRRGAVLWPIVSQLTPGIMLGAWLGAILANWASTEVLRGLFGVFALIVALQMILRITPKTHRQLPGRAAQLFIGQLIGTVSALVGIGGGTLTTPFLIWCNVSIRQAVATSAACGLPIAVAGSVGFAIIGWDAQQLPTYHTGFIYWPAFAAISASSIVCAPLGARLTHQLPVVVLRRIFAALLTVLAVHMLFG